MRGGVRVCLPAFAACGRRTSRAARRKHWRRCPSHAIVRSDGPVSSCGRRGRGQPEPVLRPAPCPYPSSPRLRRSSLAPRCTEARTKPPWVRNVSRRADATVSISSSVDRQRRLEPDHAGVVESEGGDHVAVEEAGRHFGSEILPAQSPCQSRFCKLDADHEAAASHLDDGRTPGCGFAERSEQVFSLLASARGKVVAHEDLDGLESGGRSAGVATERRGVDRAALTAAEPGLPHLVRRHEGAGRHDAASECLGQGHDVGRHAIVFAAEHGARTAEPSLDLVGNEERAGLVTSCLCSGEVAVRRDDDACLPLDRFHDERGVKSAGKCIAQGRLVPERDGVTAGQQRCERLLVLRAAADRQRTEALAVKGAVAREKAGAPCRGPCQLEGPSTASAPLLQKKVLRSPGGAIAARLSASAPVRALTVT